MGNKNFNKTYKDIALNGMVKSNPVFRLVLGMCPTLAVTTTLLNGLFMGLAVTFVLIFSNAFISLLRKIIPDKVRIPCYILIIATFVTIVEMVIEKYLPDLFYTLGVFIPLIVVNCVVFARAESFASVSPVFQSMTDGLFIGIGYTIALSLVGGIREFISQGKILGMTVLGDWYPGMAVFILPAGGFLVLGLLMAAFNAIDSKIKKRHQNTLAKNLKNKQ
ncbi:MAG: electron transport complex subunit E [Firmicutes bacterium]|nr:electron transport complex subunit E [Bacillota bacterium]